MALFSFYYDDDDDDSMSCCVGGAVHTAHSTSAETCAI